MTAGSSARRVEGVRQGYRDAFGAVPEEIERRMDVALGTCRLVAIESTGAVRKALLADDPLTPLIQPLVHLAQLPTLADLVGVAGTPLVTSGVPAYVAEPRSESRTDGAPGAGAP